MTPAPALDRQGLAAALGAFTLWGVFPLLFRAMASFGASPLEIVGWRIVWSVPFAALLVVVAGRWDAAMEVVARPRLLGLLTLSAGLIAVNWSVYVFAVSTGRTLEASLGYYLNPLISLAAGALIFGERVSPTGWAGVALAGAGVAVQALSIHALPFIPLVLAVSFAAYGVVRKRAPVDASSGLLVECVVLAAPAVLIIVLLGAAGQGHFGREPMATFLLVLAGPATVAPLAAFAFGARRLTLSIVGVLQFISPTLQFVCGVAAGERLSPLTLASFALIWSGVAVFLIGVARRTSPVTAAPAEA